MINVALVEDNPQELAGFVQDLGRASDITIVGTAQSMDQAIELIPSWKPDVVLVDLVLPDGTGAATISVLRMSLPDSNFVVLSAYEDYDRIYDAIIAGAVGYLGKSYVGDDLAQAVRDAYDGGSPISSPIARKVLSAFHVAVKPSLPIGSLTEREQQVLYVLATGRSYQDIATVLNVSVETIRTHVRHIYKKLHIHSRSEIGKMKHVP